MNERDRTVICIQVAIFCMIMVMISLWLIDMSVSGLIANRDSVLTNGFIISTPMKGYHLGLYSVLVFSTLLTMLVTYIWTRKSSH